MTLQIDDVRHAYRRRQPVLQGVDLTLPSGSFTGLLGRNGSGKSTLTKLIARVLKLTSGRISYRGADLSSLTILERSKLVAYVPQAAPATFQLSVRESVLLGRTPHYGIRPRAEDWQQVDLAIEQLGLEDLAHAGAGDLSGGQAQRVLIARALAQQPQVLLLDEPTSALDLRYQVESLMLLRRLTHEQGLTTLIAIHDLNLAARFCDAVAILHEGRVLAHGTPGDAYSAQVLETAYGLPVSVTEQPTHVEVQPLVELSSRPVLAGHAH